HLDMQMKKVRLQGENGLVKGSHDMGAVVGVYVVFQVSILGSLFTSSSSPNYGLVIIPHFYLSLAACLSTLITLLLPFITACTQEEHLLVMPENDEEAQLQLVTNEDAPPFTLHLVHEAAAPPFLLLYYCRMVVCVYVVAFPLLVYASYQRRFTV
ncbi:hypothetical protein KI387_015642, partial [Taxus chinensis]